VTQSSAAVFWGCYNIVNYNGKRQLLVSKTIITYHYTSHKHISITHIITLTLQAYYFKSHLTHNIKLPLSSHSFHHISISKPTYYLAYNLYNIHNTNMLVIHITTCHHHFIYLSSKLSISKHHLHPYYHHHHPMIRSSYPQILNT
jgi:hypothetical protein